MSIHSAFSEVIGKIGNSVLSGMLPDSVNKKEVLNVNETLNSFIQILLDFAFDHQPDFVFRTLKLLLDTYGIGIAKAKQSSESQSGITLYYPSLFHVI